MTSTPDCVAIRRRANEFFASKPFTAKDQAAIALGVLRRDIDSFLIATSLRPQLFFRSLAVKLDAYIQALPLDDRRARWARFVEETPLCSLDRVARHLGVERAKLDALEDDTLWFGLAAIMADPAVVMDPLPPATQRGTPLVAERGRDDCVREFKDWMKRSNSSLGAAAREIDVSLSTIRRFVGLNTDHKLSDAAFDKTWNALVPLINGEVAPPSDGDLLTVINGIRGAKRIKLTKQTDGVLSAEIEF